MMAFPTVHASLISSLRPNFLTGSGSAMEEFQYDYSVELAKIKQGKSPVFLGFRVRLSA